MAYKFQRGGATLSGSVTIEEQLAVTQAVTVTQSVTAGTSFIIGSADLNEVDLEKLDGITDGTAAANKAVVLDASKDITGIAALTASSFSGDGSGLTSVSSSPAGSDTQIQFNQNGSAAGDSGLTYDGSGSIDLVEADNTSIGLKLAGALVSTTAAELNFLDGATAGTAVASKALVLGATKDLTGVAALTASSLVGNKLTVNGNVDLGNGSDTINLGSGGSDTVSCKATFDIQAGIAANMQSISATTDTLASGDYYNICSGTLSQVITLPDVSAIEDGVILYVKRMYGMTGSVTIDSDGGNSESIDGDEEIVLETQNAAVSLLWDSTNNLWHIF